MTRAMILSMRTSLVGSNGRMTTRLLLGLSTIPVRRTFGGRRDGGPGLSLVADVAQAARLSAEDATASCAAARSISIVELNSEASMDSLA
ncbi:MAG: hypothetical protein ACYC61_08200 [Isosphaeraceae bacterium]